MTAERSTCFSGGQIKLFSYFYVLEIFTNEIPGIGYSEEAHHVPPGTTKDEHVVRAEKDTSDETARMLEHHRLHLEDIK